MGHFATREELDALAGELEAQRALPNADPERSHVVYWHVFRNHDDTLAFSRQIVLEKGERLVGGRTEDSIGGLWWVGVQVDDLAAWGNRRAVHKIDAFDPESPGSPML